MKTQSRGNPGKVTLWGSFWFWSLKDEQECIEQVRVTRIS